MGLTILVGAVGLLLTEDVEGGFVDALYWSVISCTTVGYGDIFPESDAGKIFCIFYLPLGTMSLARIVGNVIESRLEKQVQKRRKMILTRKLASCQLIADDENQDGKVTREEFLVSKLVAMNYCTEEQVKDILQAFDSLDIDDNGVLDNRDLNVAGLPTRTQVQDC